jgi:putative peptidoglycan lipid II flippase
LTRLCAASATAPPREYGSVTDEGTTHRSGRQSDRAIFRQSGLTGVAATAGVIAGLVLQISIAYRFGASGNTDAFFVAARIPLGLIAVVMAAANQALVPAFRTSLTQRGERSTDRLISMIFALMIIVGAALVLLSWVVAEPLVHATAPGIPDKEVLLAASMVPVVFAMVPLVAIAEVMRAYLNARYAFVAPALMTVVLHGLSAVMILALPLIGWKDIHLVAVAFLAGAGAQMLFMCVMAVRHGLRIRPALDLRDEQLRSVGKLCVRPLGASVLNPVARVGEQVMLSSITSGTAGLITILNYGYMVISAIGGTVFFRSVIVALIPRLTDAHNRDGQAEVRRFTGLGIRIMLAISLPLTAFMAVLGKPVAIAVFDRGHFTLTSAELLGAVLMVYSISLVGSAVQRALLAPFYARLDTRTPLRNAFYGVAANLLLLPALLLPLLLLPVGMRNNLAILGIALAYSLAQYVNVGHAWYRLTRTDGNPARGLGTFTLKLLAASAVSAAVMIGASIALNLGDASQHFDRVQLLIRTPIAGLAGLAALLIVMYALAGGEISSWRTLLSRRRAPNLAPGAILAPDDQAAAEEEASETLVEAAPIASNLP